MSSWRPARVEGRVRPAGPEVGSGSDEKIPVAMRSECQRFLKKQTRSKHNKQIMIKSINKTHMYPESIKSQTYALIYESV